jgi:hypothetical protein
VLTFWGIAFYFLFSAIHTFTYARTGTPLLDRFPRPLQALHCLLYTTVAVFPFIVTLVYWIILFKGPWFDEVHSAWSNVSQHLLNSVFALFELLIPRTDPMPAVHMLWIIVVLALYLAVAYVTRATKGFYTYSFLDPGKQGGLVAAYVFGIAIGGLLAFGFAWGVVWVRRWVTETKLGRKGKFSRRDKEAVERGDVAADGSVKVEAAASASAPTSAEV